MKRIISGILACLLVGWALPSGAGELELIPLVPDHVELTITALSIFAGEQVYVEVAVQNNMILGIKRVSNIIDPNSTMIFNFMKGDSGNNMTLSVKNPLSNSVKYHIDMVDYQGRLHKTSSCPVLAGLSVYEFWPHPIPEIRITNFHFTSEEEKAVCIY